MPTIQIAHKAPPAPPVNHQPVAPSVTRQPVAPEPLENPTAATLAHLTYQRSRFFPALDGLRCVSILGVIAFHSGLTNPSFFGRNGGLGVEFFFVISGFLITTLLLREQSDTGEISLKKFYIRRSLRIFPMYFTVLGLYCLATLATDRHTEEGRVFFHRLRSSSPSPQTGSAPATGILPFPGRWRPRSSSTCSGRCWSASRAANGRLWSSSAPWP